MTTEATCALLRGRGYGLLADTIERALAELIEVTDEAKLDEDPTRTLWGMLEDDDPVASALAKRIAEREREASYRYHWLMLMADEMNGD